MYMLQPMFKLAMALPKLLLASILITLATQSSLALHFEVTNNATGIPGGKRFNKEIGLPYSKLTLTNAASFIWKTFGEGEGQRKNVALETLTITSMDGVAYTEADGTYVSAEYIGNYSGDVKIEFTGVVYHEVTHVWQWAGNDSTPGGLIEGVADFVRLKAGYAPAHWVKPGQGDSWDEGYDVTARFLDYCNGVKDGFVADLNAKMKIGYSDKFFSELLGKSVGELWKEYKAHYNGTYNGY